MQTVLNYTLSIDQKQS